MGETNKKDELQISALSKTRNITGIAGLITSLFGVGMSAFHLYTAFFGIFQSVLQRSAHLGFALVLTFLVIKPSKKMKKEKIGWYDYCLVLLSLTSLGYIVYNAEAISQRMVYIDPLSSMDLIIGGIATLLLVEATRRSIGWALTIILALFIGYAFAGPYLPGPLYHQGFSYAWVTEHLFYTTNGVFGIPLGVSATFIFMFILFGKFLEKSGAGQFFIDLAISTMGKYRGGPAKTAIAASSILGTISGSAVANTVTTGSFTIPLMKKIGYKKEFAGAVESVASSGGQIVPPIMGASAFIIASYLGVPYATVAVAAIIPALLFYLCLIFQVNFRASRRGLRGMSPNQLPNIKDVMKSGFLFLTPLLLIIYLLFIGYSPMRAGLFAIVLVILVAAVKSTTRLDFKGLINILDTGARASIETAIACGAAGIITGVVSLTGIGMQFSSIIISLSGGYLFLALFFTMISSIILGMGLPTVAAYIVQVALTVPALVELGVSPLAAHMFIFYFAIVSAITPPVALAAFAGAGIAGSDPMRTGVLALRLGIGAFIVPYMFVYGPSLLMQGGVIETIITVVTAGVGIYGIAAGAEGWLKVEMKWWERLIILAASLVLIIPGLYTDIVGLAGVFAIIFIHRANARNLTSRTTAETNIQ
ncbi:TRAP transporter, 4TM/12TM fusion protein [Thalassobacillus cyri]|uniref:TRAP transporter, 4TM/12TM fusion protein n=1 Tax=Thalassobacillus cyri TaxID=571932 RepID=A0A1H4E5W6_9BACI|nr:TRAP transporter permease [Thalassobacillus cyri]SEA80435.1 TRAP transporter, 4TM/12TM fusion protein [Thalassobacillus cyri]